MVLGVFIRRSFELDVGSEIAPFAQVVEVGGEKGVGIALDINEERTHVLTSSFAGDGLITVLMLTDAYSDEVLFYAFGEDEFIVDEIDLEYGVILVKFIFLTSYESAQNFFDSMQIDVLASGEWLSIAETFNRVAVSNTVGISFWMGVGEVTPEQREQFV